MNKYKQVCYLLVMDKQGFDKPALVMDYTVTSRFYMWHYDPPWGKPPGHLLSACVQGI